MDHRTGFRAGLTLLLGVALAACGDSTAPGFSGPEEATGVTRVLLAPASADAAAASGAATAARAETGGNVSLDDVESIRITIDRLEARRVDDGDEGDDGPWISLDVEEQTVDLLDLPEEGLEVARGDLAAGDFRNVRLFLSESEIVFANDVELGAARTFEAGVAHELFIPSADKTGLKVPTARFTVAEETDVIIDFDAGASVRSLSVTGRGVVMNPVLGGRDTDETTAGE